MQPRYSAFVRSVHLYGGLFISPFVLLFAISVVLLVHSWLPGVSAPEKRIATDLVLPPDFEQLKGPGQIAAARLLLGRIGVAGEITSLRLIPRDRRFLLAVSVPGRETTVDLSITTQTAAISARTTGLWDAMVFLHKMPGPHNANLRGNSAFMSLWRGLTDATVYVILLVSGSGVFLWALLKAERRIGLVLLAGGVASLGGIIYALVA